MGTQSRSRESIENESVAGDSVQDFRRLHRPALRAATYAMPTRQQMYITEPGLPGDYAYRTSDFLCRMRWRAPQSTFFPYTTLFRSRSGARPGRPQPLRGTKGKRKGARLWYVGGQDRKSGSAGMPRPISYAVFCLKKKIRERKGAQHHRYIAIEREHGRANWQNAESA